MGKLQPSTAMVPYPGASLSLTQESNNNRFVTSNGGGEELLQMKSNMTWLATFTIEN